MVIVCGNYIDNVIIFSTIILIKLLNRVCQCQVSDGGVHSHITHLFALIKAAKLKGVPKCIVQFFGDGRDTSPTSVGE